MIDRIVAAAALIGLGLLAYRLLLSAQRRVAARTMGRAEGTGRPALLIFTSPTCAPCKLQQMPIVQQLAAGWGDRVGVRVIDVTEQPEVAAQFGVWSLPTTVVLDASGHVSAINQGVASEKKLGEQIERVSTNSSAQPLAHHPAMTLRGGGRG